MKIFQFLMFGAMSGLLMDENNNNNGGGGGGGNNNQNQNQNQGGQTVTMSKEQFDEIMARLPPKQTQQQNQNQNQNQNQGGDDLAEKARKETEAKAKKQTDSRALESALNFTIQAANWLKENASLLPKDITEIFAQAEKENYADAVEKASAIKSAVIQSFFKVQENLDLLTAAQKVTLEDWLKLTKNGKEEKAQSIYDVVFEPTFEMLRRLKKAQQVTQSGQRQSDDAEDKYKQKLIKGSLQHYTGVKQNA